MLDQHRSVVNDEWEKLFDGILHDCAERLRQDPTDFEALVRGVTVYMVVIEGTLALTAARFIVKSLKERDSFPASSRDSPRSTATSHDTSASGQVPRRRDQGRPGERPDRPGHAPGDACRWRRSFRPAVGRRPVQLRDALLPLVGDLRVRDEVALEEARRDGPRPGDARRRRLSGRPRWRARPGRPSTGARERMLEACLEVLKADGYAGLTIAKVAARARREQALVSYHFGSKQGLVAAAARELGETITAEIVAGSATAARSGG